VLVVHGAIKGVYEGDEASWRNTLDLNGTRPVTASWGSRLTRSIFATRSTGPACAPVLLRPVPSRPVETEWTILLWKFRIPLSRTPRFSKAVLRALRLSVNTLLE
jgi:hypothetical protein